MTQSAATKGSLSVSAEEHATRIELAAFYRVVEHLGWGDGVYNHIAARVPGEPTRFLMKKHALMYDEVTASNLVKVDCRYGFPAEAGVNQVGFTTHAPIMRLRSDINSSIHLHTVAGAAISCHARGLRPIHQDALRVIDRVAYSRPYAGFAEGEDQQSDIVEDLGGKQILVMRNHGVLVTGHSIEQAFGLTLAFVKACQTQLALEAAGAEVLEVPPPIAAATARQFVHHDAGRGHADWPAWIRRMDRLDPSYRD
jgi:ribulose-5-phosphate 4-epimerase/fuculose-1-phosphate aldolase